ncbi:ataxin-1-like [Rhineura floridana]|uniref:ataxin-1-like n=1 Tax=Rhineura floridana TaxID=261503 RepID=UPI002AC86E68|nr:ataxin-1-like [Rhineura floridana]XP_061449907.1 ataxin-1-like [Rhineura floridana]XP_061449908.1 ataxin-1-like [Rhineura floridana]XP_061449910.1 ataxin-1-like [Rhineura floridana]XP_061449911.1 ataxin-1-like [Rhineura floridana]
MRAAQERSQECLPPKKRDLPVAASGEETGRAAEEGPAGGSEASAEWARGAAAGRQNQAPSRYGEAGDGSEAVAGLTVDQYGLLYKVAVPPATFSPVVNVSPLPPAFGMTSQLIQHPGIPYSPVHYTQLPPTPLQFVGSHYSVPYAVPPGFLPSHLLPSSASLAASHIPHFVPYAPLLAEDSSPSAQAAHNFGKTTTASVLSSGPLQPQVGGQPPPEVTQGRLPVYYQMSRLPAGYSSFEAPAVAAAGSNPKQPLQESQIDPEVVSANGVQRSAVGAKESEIEGRWPGSAGAECSMEGPFLTSGQVVRTEVSVPSQRSTPDTDLEVQRVVGVLASQNCPVPSAQQKDDLSPLNLSHHNPPEQKADLARNPVEVAPEKSHAWRLSAKSPEEQPRHRPVLKGLTVANGRPVLGSLQLGAQDGLESMSSKGPSQTDCAHPQSHLPSHFMKGAIIQLATGELKRVEDLQTQDFVRSAEVSGGLKIDSSTVVDIQESPWQGFVTLHFVVGEQQSKVSIDVPPEHPFFVYGQGWSSCSPERTARLFSLPCHRLQVGDVCISISLQSLNGRLVLQAVPQGSTRERPGRGGQSLQELHRSPFEKGGAGVGSPQESSHLGPISLHGWAGPGFQRFGEEPRPPLLRPSFIPQEVKLSIEGRSNAGK